MKKLSIVIGIMLLVGALGIASIFMWWNANTSSVSENNEMISVVIPRGRSAEAIGKQLEEEEIIKSALAFKLYVQLYDKQESINSGEFSLSPSMTLEEVVEALGKGPEEVWVTIPEGLRREEIVERLISGIGLEGTVATNFRSEFLQLTVDNEGYLFPDTYLLPPEVSAEKVVALMLATFESRIEKLEPKMIAQGLTRDETVILASILEKETKTDNERPVVAGIYFNRLDIGQALQADATAQYVMGTLRCRNVVGECDWWKPPTRAELQTDSPFNTYKYSGLPPAPIANPGLSSLKAVVESQENPYYYYIHEPDGTIHYAETLDEHNANVARYLR